MALPDALLPVAAPATEAMVKAAPAAINTGEGASTRYYLAFTDYNNNTLSLDGGFLYEVSGLSFGAIQTLNIGSQSTGSGAGKAHFAPLTFLTASSNLTVQLDSMLASGTPFAQVNLYGYDTAPGGAPVQVVHDVFKLAAVKSDTIDAGSGQHQVAFEYGGLVETAAPLNPDGTSGTPVTPLGWNSVKNIKDTSLTTSLEGSTVTLPTTIDPRTNAAAAGVAAPLHLYARFSDYATTPNVLGGGWIEIDSANLDFIQTLNIGSQSTGAGAGKVTFDPLVLTFRPGTVEPALLVDLASGTPFKQIEIAAYATAPGGTQSTLVDDYRFNLAAVQTSTHAVAGSALTDTYTFQYGQEVLQHVTTAGDGSVTRTTKGWDAVKNVALPDALLPVAAPATEAMVKAATRRDQHRRGRLHPVLPRLHGLQQQHAEP